MTKMAFIYLLSMNERFRKFQESTGMSNEDMSKVLGLETRTFYRLKNGSAKKIDISVVKALREKFDVDLNWLFTDKYDINKDMPASLVLQEVRHKVEESPKKYGPYLDHLEEENKWLKEQNEKLLNMIADKGAEEKTHVRNSG